MKRLIMVSGPSESGKSGGINYLLSRFPGLFHLKIRDIFPELYRKSGSSADYDQWLVEAEKERDKLWTSFITEVMSRAPADSVVIMDTMYGGIDDLQAICRVLGKDFVLLYIDAPETDRARREWLRLRTDSPYSDRKGDPDITLDQVFEVMKRKDEHKRSCGIFDYPLIKVDANLRLSMSGEGERFAVVISNDSDEGTFHRALDEFFYSVY